MAKVVVAYSPGLDHAALARYLGDALGHKYEISTLGNQKGVKVKRSGWSAVHLWVKHHEEKQTTLLRTQRTLGDPWRVLLFVPMFLLAVLPGGIMWFVVLGRSKPLEQETIDALQQGSDDNWESPAIDEGAPLVPGLPVD